MRKKFEKENKWNPLSHYRKKDEGDGERGWLRSSNVVK